jgi:hypothetical protein
MKTFILSMLLVSLASVSFAQAGKVTIYCDVSSSITGLRLDYYGAGKFLPDSIRSAVLIDYNKLYRFRYLDVSSVLLLMSTDGWKICARVETVYTVSKDIEMDGPTFQQYTQKIKDSFVKFVKKK